MISAIGSRSGFTLAEISMVIALLGLISILCWPSLRRISERFLSRANVNEILLELQKVRERALVSGLNQTWIPTSRTLHYWGNQHVTFYSDGTSHLAHLDFGPRGNPCYRIHVDETGRIAVHET